MEYTVARRTIFKDAIKHQDTKTSHPINAPHLLPAQPGAVAVAHLVGEGGCDPSGSENFEN